MFVLTARSSRLTCRHLHPAQNGPWTVGIAIRPASSQCWRGRWKLGEGPLMPKCGESAARRVSLTPPSPFRCRPSLACWGSPATVRICSSSFAQVRRSAICSGSSPPFGQAAPHFLWVLSSGPSQLSSFCWVHRSNTLGSSIHSRPARTGPQRPTTLHLTESVSSPQFLLSTFHPTIPPSRCYYCSLPSTTTRTAPE